MSASESRAPKSSVGPKTPKNRDLSLVEHWPVAQQLLQERLFTIKAIARDCGVAATTIRDIRMQVHRPTVDTAERVVRWLHELKDRLP
jgi:hypothetical protein